MKKVSRSGIMLALAIPVTFLVARTGMACNDAPGLVEIENATYTGLDYGPVTLSNGEWEGAPYVEGGASRPKVGLVRDFRFTGDLNGDGDPETAVILWESSGGTGSYTYLAVMARQNDEVANIATALIGDRVKFKDGQIEGGRIILDVLQAGENDAMCCPTMLATRTWSLTDGQLTEGEIEVTGKFSPAAPEGLK